MIFVILAFGTLLIFGLEAPDNFEKVLVFISTLIGSITGYYFAASRLSGATRSHAPTAPSGHVKPRENAVDANVDAPDDY
jgi:hypothetical protein